MRRAARWLGLLAVAGVAALVLGAVPSPGHAGAAPSVPAARGGASCDAGRAPATASFEVRAQGTAASPELSAVQAIRIVGLASRCDGATAVLTVLGNGAGRAGGAPELLATVDSSVEPCRQVARSVPLRVSAGAITLAFCASGGPAQDPPVHEITALSLLVGGSPVPVTPTPTPVPQTQPSTHGGSPGGGSTGGSGTGAPGGGGGSHITGAGSGTHGAGRALGTRTGGGAGGAGAVAPGTSAVAPGTRASAPGSGVGHRATSSATGVPHGVLLAANLAFDWWPLVLVLLLLLLALVGLFLGLRQRQQGAGATARVPT